MSQGTLDLKELTLFRFRVRMRIFRSGREDSRGNKTLAASTKAQQNVSTTVLSVSRPGYLGRKFRVSRNY